MAAHPGRISYVHALLLATGLAAALPASAADQGPYAFIGGGVGYWDTGDDSRDIALDNLGGGTGSSDRTSGALKAGIGYQFNTYHGVDLAYHNTGRFGLKLQTDFFGRVNYDIKARRIAASYILNIPATTNLSFTGRVGINRWEEKVTENAVDLGQRNEFKRNDTDAVWGLGMRYRLNPTTSLAVEYESFHQQEDDLYWDFGEGTIALLVKF